MAVSIIVCNRVYVLEWHVEADKASQGINAGEIP